MDWSQQTDMRKMGRDIRVAKAKSSIQIHQDAVALGSSTTLAAATTGGVTAYLAHTMVKVAQRHLFPHTIRRSNASLDNNGQHLNAQLPALTEVLVTLIVTESEAKDSYKEIKHDAVQAKLFDTNQLGVSAQCRS